MVKAELLRLNPGKMEDLWLGQGGERLDWVVDSHPLMGCL